MSIRERLKVAYENAAYGADKTWSSGFHGLQKPNMDLLMRESQIQDSFDGMTSPRTVHESIPNSKLATYFDYPYNTSRELSYAPDFRQLDCAPMCFKHDIFKEPWMYDAVEYHCRYYMECDASKKSFTTFESPFLKVCRFPDYFIKLGLNSKAVRRLWDAKNVDTRSFMYRTPSPIPDRSLVLYKPPMGEVVYREHDNERLSFADSKKAYDQDETHLRLVEASLKQLQDQQKINSTETQAVASASDGSQSKRLYSAVLQGCSSTNKNVAPPAEGQMTILKRTVSKNDRTVQVSSELDKKEPEQLVQIPVWRRSRQVTNTLIHNSHALTMNHLIPQLNAARLLASALASTPQHQLGAVPPIAPRNLLHLSHPVILGRPVAPLLTQNQFQASTSYHMFKPKARTKLQARSLKKTNPSGVTVKRNLKMEALSTNNHTSTSVDVDQALDELVLRIVDVVLGEPDLNPEPRQVFPLTGSLFDDLERQALEQYNSSNDNMLQELERQAVEQYEGCSENCQNPRIVKLCSGVF